MAVPEKCKGCGSDLIYHEWNSDVDVAVCDNFRCLFYRNPISVEKGTHELVTTHKPLKRAGKGRLEYEDEEEGESQRALEELREMRRALLGKKEGPEVL